MYPNPIPESEVLFFVLDRKLPEVFDHVRLLKAMDIVISGYVQPDGTLAGWQSYLIESNQGQPFNGGSARRVTGNNCTCPDAQTGHTCKHVIARVIYERITYALPIPTEIQYPARSTVEILEEVGD